nr:class II D-tagatose-bisphosphate aldolase, non-catalytic subunit [Jannaschia sp. S6380]
MIARNRAGEAIGLPSFCTANGHVLRAILAHAARTGAPTVIEATSNQVNQDGGYTGMDPAGFMSWLTGMAHAVGAPMDRLILGGDHLGPNPWRDAPAAEAMARAGELVRLYVEAGFTKIHLDASMALGGERPPSFETIATRAAELCAVAERHAPDPDRLIYVIGTEVPIPGGETEEPDALDVTTVARLEETIETHRAAFASRGLQAAWGRIVSVVTQPGVDFGHSRVYDYTPEATRDLSAAILRTDGLTFEAHSTDYQPTRLLRALVGDHFFFLKVGPELTFRFREAVIALSRIEDALTVDRPSGLRDTLDRRMREDDRHWSAYYRGDAAEIARQKLFSYSDRVRYYWSDAQVATALDRLLGNLSALDLPAPLVSQFFTDLGFDDVPTGPEDLIAHHVDRCIARYFAAAGFGDAGG